MEIIRIKNIKDVLKLGISENFLKEIGLVEDIPITLINKELLLDDVQLGLLTQAISYKIYNNLLVLLVYKALGSGENNSLIITNTGSTAKSNLSYAPVIGGVNIVTPDGGMVGKINLIDDIRYILLVKALLAHKSIKVYYNNIDVCRDNVSASNIKGTPDKLREIMASYKDITSGVWFLFNGILINTNNEKPKLDKVYVSSNYLESNPNITVNTSDINVDFSILGTDINKPLTSSLQLYAILEVFDVEEVVILDRFKFTGNTVNLRRLLDQKPIKINTRFFSGLSWESYERNSIYIKKVTSLSKGWSALHNIIVGDLRGYYGDITYNLTPDDKGGIINISESFINLSDINQKRNLKINIVNSIVNVSKIGQIVTTNKPDYPIESIRNSVILEYPTILNGNINSKLYQYLKFLSSWVNENLKNFQGNLIYLVLPNNISVSTNYAEYKDIFLKLLKRNAIWIHDKNNVLGNKTEYWGKPKDQYSRLSVFTGEYKYFLDEYSKNYLGLKLSPVINGNPVDIFNINRSTTDLVNTLMNQWSKSILDIVRTYKDDATDVVPKFTDSIKNRGFDYYGNKYTNQFFIPGPVAELDFHEVLSINGKSGDIDKLSPDDVESLTDTLSNKLDRSEFEDHLTADNPHKITKSTIGLGKYEDYEDPMDLPISKSASAKFGELDDRIDTKVGIATFNEHLNDKNNPHEVTKEQVGLGNVDNTSDTDKPISTATRSEFDRIEKVILPKKANLNADGKVPLTELPDSVLGNLRFAGVWDASANQPELKIGEDDNFNDSKKGLYYIVEIAGVRFGYEFDPGDWVVCHLINGKTMWSKIDNVDAVKSVNGKKGVVVINTGDIEGLDNELAKKADKDEVVFRTKDQSIEGIKSFLNPVVVPAANKDDEAVNKSQAVQLVKDHSPVKSVVGRTGEITLDVEDVNGLNDALNLRARHSELVEHTSNQNNPHNVTANQLGVGSFKDYTPATLPISSAVQLRFDQISSTLDTKAKETDLNRHIDDQVNPHGIQDKLDNLENKIDKKSKDTIKEIDTKLDTKADKSNTYTKEDIDNKIAQVVNDIDWKESVNNYNEIAVKYPDPQDGWTVNTKDRDETYRFDGQSWVLISANSIPLATKDVDGKMSHRDKAKVDSIEEGAQKNTPSFGEFTVSGIRTLAKAKTSNESLNLVEGDNIKIDVDSAGGVRFSNTYKFDGNATTLGGTPADQFAKKNDVVTLDTNQTISGDKTFTGNIIIPKLDDKVNNKVDRDSVYTKEDIDNKISQLVNDIDWKESVTTFVEIGAKYPDPKDGWTVNTKDTNETFRFDGDKWISISANSIPLATETLDGRLSKEDKKKLNSIEDGAQKNENSFGTISVSGLSSVSKAKTPNDNLNLIEGKGIDITIDTAGGVKIDSTFDGDADKLGGKAASEYALKSEIVDVHSNQTISGDKTFTGTVNIPGVTDKLSDVYSKSDVYNRNEVDNKISEVLQNIDWKESVDTYEDIATTYPKPQDGWTVNVRDTDITYRFDGKNWIKISSNSIPLATSTVDGKMSKEDKIKLDDIESGAQVNKPAISKIQVVNGKLFSATNVESLVNLKSGKDIGIKLENDTITFESTYDGNATKLGDKNPNEYALDSRVVHRSGNEDIAGDKNFVGNLTIKEPTLPTHPATNRQITEINEKIATIKSTSNSAIQLDSTGKIPWDKLPDSLLGAVHFAGTINLDDWKQPNVTLVEGLQDDHGKYYIAGTDIQLTIGSKVIELNTGDWVINSKGIWSKVDNVDAVKSVNGKTGNVVLTMRDIKVDNSTGSVTLEQKIDNELNEIRNQVKSNKTNADNQFAEVKGSNWDTKSKPSLVGLSDKINGISNKVANLENLNISEELGTRVTKSELATELAKYVPWKVSSGNPVTGTISGDLSIEGTVNGRAFREAGGASVIPADIAAEIRTVANNATKALGNNPDINVLTREMINLLTVLKKL